MSVYHGTEREFSVGERIQFTAPDRQLGVANRELSTIERIDPDGNISVRTENNRTIRFNAAEHPHFDHGYAVTSHGSQGLTPIVCSSMSILPLILISSTQDSRMSRCRVQVGTLKSTRTTLLVLDKG